MASLQPSSSSSDVRSATYLSSGTPSRSHFALVKRLENAAATPGGAYQHALDISTSSLAQDLSKFNPSSDADGLYTALMPVAYLDSIGAELSQHLKKAALLPTLQLLSSQKASAQQLHLAWGLLPALLTRKGSLIGDAHEDDVEASHSLLLLSTLTTHLTSSRPAVLEQALRSLTLGFPQGPDILPALLGPVRSLARAHPNARCRARALEAWLKLVGYHEDDEERRASRDEVWSFVVGRLSEEHVGVPAREREVKGKSKARDLSLPHRPLDPSEAAACLRLVEQLLSTQPSSPSSATQALGAVASLLRRIEPSLQVSGARTPFALLELSSNVIGKAIRSRAQDESPSHEPESKASAMAMVADTLRIWSALISKSRDQVPHHRKSLHGSVSSSTSASTIQGGAKASSSASAVAQGQLLSLSISLSSILGSFRPLLPPAATSTWAQEAELHQALLSVQDLIRDLLGRKNPNARLACVRVLRNLVGFGWAEADDGAGNGSSKEMHAQDGERFQWSRLLEERHWGEMLAWTEAGDDVLRKETLHLLAVVDVGILSSYQTSLLSRTGGSGSSLSREDTQKLECRALEVGIIVAAASHAAQPRDEGGRRVAAKGYVQTLLGLFKHDHGAQRVGVGHLLAQSRRDLVSAERGLASDIMLEVLGATAEAMGAEKEQTGNRMRQEQLLLCAILAFEFPPVPIDVDVGARGVEESVERLRKVIEHLCVLLSRCQEGTITTSLLVALFRHVALLPSSTSTSTSTPTSSSSINISLGTTRRTALATVARLTEGEQEHGRGEGEVGRVGSALLRLMRDETQLRAVGAAIREGEGLLEGREMLLRGRGREEGKKVGDEGGKKRQQKDERGTSLGSSSPGGGDKIKPTARKPLRYAAYGDVSSAASTFGSTFLASSTSSVSTTSPSVFLASRNVNPPPAPSSREGGRLLRQKRREEERLGAAVREDVRRVLADEEDGGGEWGEGGEEEGGEDAEGGRREEHQARGREKRGAEREKQTRQDRSDSLTSRPDLILFDADTESERVV